jgi:hypothetical protein
MEISRRHLGTRPTLEMPPNISKMSYHFLAVFHAKIICILE